MKRGDIVIVNAGGDYGKPRPAVIIQSDLFNGTHASVVVCLITSELVDAPLFRLSIPKDPMNGLLHPSQIMIDKIVTIRCDKITQIIGYIDDILLLQINRSLALFLAIA